jgi:hypothetical protein
METIVRWWLWFGGWPRLRQQPARAGPNNRGLEKGKARIRQLSERQIEQIVGAISGGVAQASEARPQGQLAAGPPRSLHDVCFRPDITMNKAILPSTLPTTGLSKCPTGIQGLDEITGGGLPRGRPTLVCGGAGCGKTLFAAEFLVRGAVQFGEPGVFMSFEETEAELKANVASRGQTGRSANACAGRRAERIGPLAPGGCHRGARRANPSRRTNDENQNRETTRVRVPSRPAD